MSKTIDNLEDAFAAALLVRGDLPRGPIRDLYWAMIVEGLRKEYGSEPVALAIKEWEIGS